MEFPDFRKFGDNYAFALLTKNNLVLSFKLEGEPTMEDFFIKGEKIKYEDLPELFKERYQKMKDF